MDGGSSATGGGGDSAGGGDSVGGGGDSTGAGSSAGGSRGLSALPVVAPVDTSTNAAARGSEWPATASSTTAASPKESTFAVKTGRTRSRRHRAQQASGDKYRQVVLGHGEEADAQRHDLHEHFATNAVRNTKYRWYSLVPKSLWNQFRRLANVYFLVMSVLMMIGNYTTAFDAPIEGINTLITLIVTMLITMIIEAKDDCERARKDRVINNSEAVRLHAGLDLLGMDAAHPRHRLWRHADFHGVAPGEHKHHRHGAGAVAAWKDVVVGDLVVVFKDDTFPADMLLLASAAPDGSCFIETKSIDGETNLKKRRPVPGVAALPGQHQSEAEVAATGGVAGAAASRAGPFHTPSPCEAANAFLAGHGHVQCEHPNVHVDENPGELHLTVDTSRLRSAIPGTVKVDANFHIQNTVLRGCQLRNTQWALGVVLYTGKETKVAMNTKPTPSKLSTLDKLLNRALLVLLGGLVLLTVVSDGLAIWWRTTFFQISENVRNGSRVCGEPGTSCEPAYLFPLNQPFDNFLLPSWLAYFFTFAILYSNFVPIVLYVLVEVLNTWLAGLITQDADMYDPMSGEAAMVRSTNLCQELGQIEYVFSDKTGTITKNCMRFKGWSVCRETRDEATGVRSYGARRVVDPAFDPAVKAAAAAAADARAEGQPSPLAVHASQAAARGRNSGAMVDVESSSGEEQLLRPTSASSVGLTYGPDGPEGASQPVYAMLLRRLRKAREAARAQRGRARAASEMQRMRQLLVSMSVAHTVVIAPSSSDGAADDGPPSLDADCDDLERFLERFQSASPDELCLVKAAARVGMVYRGTIHGCVVVEVVNPDLRDDDDDGGGAPAGGHGAKVTGNSKTAENSKVSGNSKTTGNSKTSVGAQESKAATPDAAAAATPLPAPVPAAPLGRRFRVFKLLVTTKFNSTRKRMSVVVREMAPRCHATAFPRGGLDGMDVSAVEWGPPLVLCKGADNVVLERSRFAEAAAREAVAAGAGAGAGTGAAPKDGGAGSRPSSGGSTGSGGSGGDASLRRKQSFRSAPASPAEGIKVLNEHLDDFSRAGLRTLVFAQRALGEEAWAAWAKQLKQALATNRVGGEQLADAQEVHLRMGEQLEGDFEVLGASAIDDELQDNVGVTIKALRRADIKVWVLTGDKLETAISIGLSCEIIDTEMSLLELSHRSLGLDDSFSSLAQLRESGGFEAARTVVDGHLTQAVLKMRQVWPYLEQHKSIYRDPQLGQMLQDAWANIPAFQREQPVDKANPLVRGITTDRIDNVGMVITGKLLDIIMTDEGLREKLLVVAVLCTSVIACRVSPLQKAEIVRLVQRGVTRNPVTLAIGDGANDVTMIQQAQVGVGLSGVEGLQAANASDFSVAQFQFLLVLMMKHGRWNYRRLSKLVLFFYYKNMLLPFTVFFYSFYTGFSGTTLYDSYTMQLYNILFTTPPILAIGAFDTDVLYSVMRKFPELYECGRVSSDLNNGKMATQLIFSVLHSLCIFGWPRLLTLALNTTNNNSIQFLGVCTFTNLVTTVNFRAFALTYSWNDVNTCFSIVTMVFLFLFLALYSLMYFLQPDFYWVGLRALAEPVYWLSLVCCLLSVTVIDYGSELFRLQFYPSLMDLGRRLDRSERRRLATEEVDSETSVRKQGAGDGDGEAFVELSPDAADGGVEMVSKSASSASSSSASLVGGEAKAGGRRAKGRVSNASSSSGGSSGTATDAEEAAEEDEARRRERRCCNGGCARDPKTKLLMAPLFQQKAPSWNPVPTPEHAPLFFAAAGVAFLIVGAATLAAAVSVVTYKLEYDGADSASAAVGANSFEEGYDVRLRMPCPQGCACVLQVPLVLDVPAEADLLLAFELSAEFHQNYFRYSRNRSFPQLRRFEASLPQGDGDAENGDEEWGDVDHDYGPTYFRDCGVSPLVELDEAAAGRALDDWAASENRSTLTTYYPCGLIANTFFADSVEVVAPGAVGVELPAGKTAFPAGARNVTLDQSTLAWPSDDFVYAQPAWWNDTLTYDQCINLAPGQSKPPECAAGRPAKFSYIYEQPHVRDSEYFAPRLFEKGVADPHLRTWMRSSGLGPTWKHFGVLAGGLDSIGGLSSLRNFPAPTGWTNCTTNYCSTNTSEGYCVVRPVGLTNVPAGTKMLELAVVSTFDVDSFAGSKTLVLTTRSTLGNLEESVAFPCLVIGACCLVVAAAWFIFQRTTCTSGGGKCRFEALLARRLTAKQKKTMDLRRVKDIARSIE